MINSDPVSSDPIGGDPGQDAAVQRVLRSGPAGAIVLAGVATAIVVAIWFAFYLLVFVPRAAVP